MHWNKDIDINKEITRTHPDIVISTIEQLGLLIGGSSSTNRDAMYGDSNKDSNSDCNNVNVDSDKDRSIDRNLKIFTNCCGIVIDNRYLSNYL
jgi:hypothetical protein